MSVGLEPTLNAGKTPAEKLEGIAFTFCKVATVCLIAGRFALPVAAGLAAIFYIAAFVKGKSDTRCILRFPLLIAGLWACVAVASTWAILDPEASKELASRVLHLGR